MDRTYGTYGTYMSYKSCTSHSEFGFAYSSIA